MGWDKDSYVTLEHTPYDPFSVVIDGKHRLAALYSILYDPVRYCPAFTEKFNYIPVVTVFMKFE